MNRPIWGIWGVGFWEFVRSEWGVVKGAPLTFVILAALAASGGFWAGAQWRNPELAAKDTYIEDLKVTGAQVSKFGKTAAEAPPQDKALTWTVNGEPADTDGGPLVDALQKSGWSATFTPNKNGSTVSTSYSIPDGTIAIQPGTPGGYSAVIKALNSAKIPYVEYSGGNGSPYVTVPQFDYYDTYTPTPSASAPFVPPPP